MPQLTECLVGKKKVSIGGALLNRKRDFRCLYCHGTVRPTKQSHDGSREAHFTHRPWVADCYYSRRNPGLAMTENSSRGSEQSGSAARRSPSPPAGAVPGAGLAPRPWRGTRPTSGIGHHPL